MAKSAKHDKKVTDQEYLSNKILVALSFAFISVMGLMLIYRGYSLLSTMHETHMAVTVLTVVFAVSTGFFGGLYFFQRKKGIAREKKIFTPKTFLALSAAAFVCMFVVFVFEVSAIKFLYALIPLSIGLYFIKNVYPVSFFLTSCILLFNGVLFYVFNKAFDYISFAGKQPLISVGLIIFNLLVLTLLLVLRKAKEKGWFKNTDDKSCIIAAGVIPSIFYIAYFVLSTPAMRYGLFMTAGLLFLLAVYYTFKLLTGSK